MRKRAVKRYAGEDESLVEISEVEEPEIESRKLDERPDVEGMKRGIAAGTPSDRQTARDIQSFKAAEVKFATKKPKPKSVRATKRVPDESAAETSRLERQAKTTSSEKNPSEKSSSKGALAAGLGLAALAGGALGSRRIMKEGSRSTRVEPTMERKSPVRSMTAEEAAWEGEGGRSYRKGGKAKKMASGGKTSSASGRADGIAQRGKTRGRIC